MIVPFPISRSRRWVDSIAGTIMAKPAPFDTKFWQDFMTDYRRMMTDAAVEPEITEVELRAFADMVFAEVWQMKNPSDGGGVA